MQREQQYLPSSVLVNNVLMLVRVAVQQRLEKMAGYASISCYRQLNIEVTGQYDILFYGIKIRHSGLLR